MKFAGENRSTRGETCPSATLSITNTTWTDPGSKPGLTTCATGKTVTQEGVTHYPSSVFIVLSDFSIGGMRTSGGTQRVVWWCVNLFWNFRFS
jgi:hypothetical protein